MSQVADATITRSFLKWAGGKTRTAATLADLGPPEGFTRYVEPFCGSAAVFFALRPSKAVLADANLDLIVCLQQVATDPNAVMEAVDGHPKTKSHYLAVREHDPAELGDVDRAARTLYLNKMSFRGLWRVNRAGQFNVPWGDYADRRIYDRHSLLAASEALQVADIRHAGFRDTVAAVEIGDFVYLDPPYVPDRKWGDFTRYTADQFDERDHVDLAGMCVELDAAGVRWMLTNSDTDLVRDLYGPFHIRGLATRRDITLDAADRSSRDLVIANYPLEHDSLIDV